jgi:hypothetical protein
MNEISSWMKYKGSWIQTTNGFTLSGPLSIVGRSIG